MNIYCEWHKVIYLNDGSKENLIFNIDETLLPDESGCYVFFNEYGEKRRIIYIGRANNLRQRIKEQLNNVRLMNGIKNFGKGYKAFIYCTIKPKRGQNLKKILEILERNLIKYAFTEGHELVNIQGAKIHFHEISFHGNRASESLFSRKILSPTK